MKRIDMTKATAFAAGVSAMLTAACVNPTDAQELASASGGTLRCAVVTRDLGGSVEFSGKVSAAQNTFGTYEMSIRQSSYAGSAVINQSGEFDVAAGRMVTLGQAVLGGAPQSYRAELYLNVGGQRLRCGTADS